MAMGLYDHKNAYLKDGWNVMDFIVVVMSWVDLVATAYSDANLAAFKVFRAMRVIRPLRSVKRNKSLRQLLAIILRSLPELANTQAFMVFFFFVFGIVGIQNFHGGIYNRCRLTEIPINGTWDIDPDQSKFICNPQLEKYGKGYCSFDTFCGSPLNNTLSK
jgi:hypothetical protein